LYQINYGSDKIVVLHNLTDETVRLEVKNELLEDKKIVDYLNRRAKFNQGELEIPSLSSVLLK
jgi:hypothetical protein